MSKRVFYHTQNSRKQLLTEPILCTKDTAWLGNAIYFWNDLDDADDWGNTSKRENTHYEVYKCDIEIENILNTVFDEEHYNFWYRQIVKVAKSIISKTKMKPTLKELNDYFKEKGTWDDVDGIMFQDLPTNPEKLLIQPIVYRVSKRKITFPYRKRIQLAVYNSNIISNFALLKKERHI